jgi:hypothetical protein
MSVNLATGLGGTVAACGVMGLFLGMTSKVTGIALVAVGLVGGTILNSKAASDAGASLTARVTKIVEQIPEGLKETAKTAAFIVAIGACIIGSLAFIGYACVNAAVNR